MVDVDRKIVAKAQHTFVSPVCTGSWHYKGLQLKTDLYMEKLESIKEGQRSLEDKDCILMYVIYIYNMDAKILMNATN